jgi:uncharacterized membrane protein YfcA
MLALLMVAAFAGGLVDAIAGGGGLITLPALLAAGLDPAAAIATNKGQAVFGSSTSFATFAWHGEIDRARAGWSLAFAAAGSLVGARAVLLLDPKLLRPVVVGLLLVAAIAALARRPQAEAHSGVEIARRRVALVTAAVALVLGAYDGFFGPGTGTFLLLANAYLFGDPLVRASGNAKVANFASNVAAFAMFAASGTIRWGIALPMAVAQMAGALVGTKLAVRRGASLVRLVTVGVSLALAIRVAWQMR